MTQEEAGGNGAFRRRPNPMELAGHGDDQVPARRQATQVAQETRRPAVPDERDAAGSGVSREPVMAATQVRRFGRARRFLGLLTLLLLPVVGALAGYAVALVTPSSYTAEAYVLISSTGDAGEVTPGDIAQAVARVATSESVLAAGDGDDLVLASGTTA